LAQSRDGGDLGRVEVLFDAAQRDQTLNKDFIKLKGKPRTVGLVTWKMLIKVSGSALRANFISANTKPES